MWALAASKYFVYKYSGRVSNCYAVKIFLKSNPNFGAFCSSRWVFPQKNTENVVACWSKSLYLGQTLSLQIPAFWSKTGIYWTNIFIILVRTPYLMQVYIIIGLHLMRENPFFSHWRTGQGTIHTILGIRTRIPNPRNSGFRIKIA